MPLDPYYSVLSLAQRQAIGAINWDVGRASKMDYGDYYDGGSAAWLSDLSRALKKTFLYGNAVFGGQENDTMANIPPAALKKMINPNLDASLPVLLGIYATPLTGHSMVADGYGYNDSTLYHHLNMGWSGLDDAWYNLPDILIPDFLDFTVVSACVYNIFPQGKGEIISGRVTDKNGNPLSDVSITAARSGGDTFTAVTNSRGIYALAKIPSASSYTISASKAGYNFRSRTVSTLTSSKVTGTVGNVWGVNFSDADPPVPVKNISEILLLLLLN
jgi:hypothetical protein